MREAAADDGRSAGAFLVLAPQHGEKHEGTDIFASSSHSPGPSQPVAVPGPSRSAGHAALEDNRRGLVWIEDDVIPHKQFKMHWEQLISSQRCYSCGKPVP